MTEDRFWALIAETIEPTRYLSSSAIDRLRGAVGRLSDDELTEFVRMFFAAHRRAYTNDLWAAGYLIQDTMSDDGFVDFRSWLIAHGRGAFERALADPDTIADLHWRHDLEDMSTAELFADVAISEYRSRLGEPPDELGSFYPDAEPTGADFPEDDADWFIRRFPRLADRVRLSSQHRFGTRWGVR